MKCLIFDMDGVILDSEPYSRKCWDDAGARMGLEHDRLHRAVMEIIGTNSAKSREIVCARCGDMPGFDYDRLLASSKELYRKIAMAGIPLKPGTREILTWLREQGIPTGLASSTETGVVREELAASGILGDFDVIVGGDQVSRSKPDPEIFEVCAARLGMLPQECWVVEDSYNGVRAGAAAGMQVFMIPDLLPATDEMRTLARVLPDLKALLELAREQTERK